MMKSFTRKFLAKELPDLSDKTKDIWQRYYLYNKNSVVIRIQQINDNHELERKVSNGGMREVETIKITADEFTELKKYATQEIKRESYQIQENPRILLRVYLGDYVGLTRIEVSFKDKKEASTFTPPNWFGREITNTPLAQEGRLLNITMNEFQKMIKAKHTYPHKAEL